MNTQNNSDILNQQLQGLLSSPAISANAVSSFQGTANAITKGVDVSFTMVDITGISTITLRRNYLNDMATATVLQSWSAILAPYTWSDTDAALQTSQAAYYWLVFSPTGTSGTPTNIGPQEVFLSPQTTAPTAATSISASHGAAMNGSVMVTVNVNGVPATGSIKIYVTGYQGNSNPVAVAQQTSSPLQFPLLQTGETITLTAIGVSAGGTEAASGPSTTLVLNGTATIPAKPQGVSVAQLPGGNQITFPASLDNVTSYQIWRANQGDPFSSATLLHTITPTNVGLIEYLDTGGYAGNYEYFVVAVNGAGSSLPSDPASAQFIPASSVLYVDGVAVQALQPAAQGADVTADQPIVYTGVGSNLIPNGTFILDNDQGWVGATGGGTGPVYRSAVTHGLNGIELTTNTSGCSSTFNVIPGQKYRFSFTCWITTFGTLSVTHRLVYGASYLPNTQPGGSNTNIDFLSAGSINSLPTTYTYDWTCPPGVYYASLVAYQAAPATAITFYSNFAAQDYVAAAQWGADVTGSNTANNTSNVGSRPATDVSNTINPGGGIDFLNAGNTNQGALATVNQANTVNIVAGAVNSNIVYSSTSVINVPSGTVTPVGQATISTNGGYVKVTAMMEVFANSGTTSPSLQVSLWKGAIGGTPLASFSNIFLQPSTVFGSTVVSIQTVDASPGSTQQYTVGAYSASEDMQCDGISLILENAKV